jgi:hypothetical protein
MKGVKMAALKNNNYAMKFKTAKERKELAHRYYLHCEQGLSDSSFEIDEETLKKYASDFPDDVLGTIKEARRKRQLFWEQMGIDGAMGLIDGFNAATWIFNMKNRFGWRDNKENQINNPIPEKQEEPETTEEIIKKGREALDALEKKGKYAVSEPLGERLG